MIRTNSRGQPGLPGTTGGNLIDKDCLSSEQKDAIDAIRRGENVFITGAGGTGKSLVVRVAVEELRKDGKVPLITAVTGAAADHLGGITLHKALGLSTHLVQDGHLAEFSTAYLEKTDVLFVDEVSMANSLMIEILWNAAEACRKKGHPVQVVCMGDFHQLGPVLSRAVKKEYGSLPGFNPQRFFAFQSEHWNDFHFHVAPLTIPFRQKDPEFVRALSFIRLGLPDGVSHLMACGLSRTPIEGAPWICGTKKRADTINRQKIAEFPGQEHKLQADVNGFFPDEERPVPATLHLKIGMPVVIIVNDPLGNYVNGTQGMVCKVSKNTVTVLLSGKNKRVKLGRHTWTAASTEAAIKQFPILPAFALTVHRVQGMTLEEANFMPFSWDHGQFYTAVSRVKEAGRLYIEGRIDPKWIVCDPAVTSWYQSEGISFAETVDSSVDTAQLTPVPMHNRREGLRFSCHEHRVKFKELLLSRTFICTSLADRSIVGVTNYSEYLVPAIAKGSRPIESDNKVRCSFVALFLNYVFIDGKQIDSLEELTVEMARDFVSQYALGLYGKGRHQKDTVDKCINAVSDFMEGLLDDPSLSLMYRRDDLYKKALRRGIHAKGLRAKGKIVYLSTLTHGIFYDCEDHVINRNMPEPALYLFMSRVWRYHPEILMNVCLSLAALLRPSETCALTWKDISIKWSGNSITSVLIDLRHETCIREDGVCTGKIKVPRRVKIEPVFLTLFQLCYQRYVDWTGMKHPEGKRIPISVNRDGEAITYRSYYRTFKEVMDEIVPDMLDDPSASLNAYAQAILDEGIGPHVLRHLATLVLVMCGYSADELKTARGDHSIESAQTYLANKGKLNDYISELVEKLCQQLQDYLKEEGLPGSRARRASRSQD